MLVRSIWHFFINSLPLEFIHPPLAQRVALRLTAYAVRLSSHDIPLHYFFISRKQNELFSFKQILGVGRQICLKKNLFCIILRGIVTHYPSPYFYFPLAQQILSQADIGSWPANLLEKEFVVHSIAGYRTIFRYPPTPKRI